MAAPVIQLAWCDYTKAQQASYGEIRIGRLKYLNSARCFSNFNFKI